MARIRAGAVRWRSDVGGPIPPGSAVRHAPGARSWANHREAAVATAKTITGMAIVGALWAATGWRDGATMLVSASVFLTLFAASDSARGWVTQICLGSVCGGAAAVLYVLLLPLARTPLETALLATPFLLIGAWDARGPAAPPRPARARGAARPPEDRAASVDVGEARLRRGAPAGAAEGPVASALARVRAEVHRPADCAEALERAAELLDGSAPPPSPADDAARYLRDAARILRREHALFER